MSDFWAIFIAFLAGAATDEIIRYIINTYNNRNK